MKVFRVSQARRSAKDDLGSSSAAVQQAAAFIAALVAISACSKSTQPEAESHVVAQAVVPTPKTDAAADGSVYRVNLGPPADDLDTALTLRIAREADLVALCTAESFQDLYGTTKDIYHLFKVRCGEPSVWKGHAEVGVIKFLWHVEKGNRIPPVGARLLVLLQARKPQQLATFSDVPWASLDVGVFYLSPTAIAKLEPKLRRNTRARNK